MDLKRAKDRIWAKHERQSGVPLSQDLRDVIEEMLSIRGDDDLEDLDDSIPDYIPIIQASGSTTTSRSAPTSPRKRYRKSFERRLYLLGFVIDHADSPGARISWQRVTTEWNKAHPSDLMTPAVLKTEFYRARQDGSVIGQLIMTKKTRATKEFIWNIVKRRWKTGSSLQKEGKESARTIEEIIVGHSLPDMPENEFTGEMWWAYTWLIIDLSLTSNWVGFSEAERERAILSFRTFLKECQQDLPDSGFLQWGLLDAIGGNYERLNNQKK